MNENERTVESLKLKLGQLVRVRNPDETNRKRTQAPTFIPIMEQTIGKTLSIKGIINDKIVVLENKYHYHVEWLDVEYGRYGAIMEVLNVL